MADGDGTAKRAWPGPPSDDLDAKRQRAGLTEEKHTRLGLTNDQVGLLALEINEVEELEEDRVQAWVEAVLREGRQKGSIEDKDSFIGKTVAVLAENGVTGAALVKLTVEELRAVGIALGPATLLVSRLAPSPLLAAVAAPAEQLDLATEKGRKRLVEVLCAKLGLRTDRLETCARLDAGRLAFAQTQEREGAFADLLQVWKGNFEADTPRNKLPLPAVPAAPGTGKTRFAWLAATRGRFPGSATVDEEWRKATDKLEAGDFRTGIENAIGVAVTFNCDADPVEGEEHRYMIGVRMLYGHFCDVGVVTFVRFLELLRYHGCHQIDTATALQIIERDIEVNHALDGGAKRHVILVVDEPLRAMNADTAKERREQLGALTTSVGQLITNFPQAHVLMTSLSGKDLDEASKTASGRTVHFVSDFVLLSKAAVEALVAAEKDTVRRERLQTDRRFRAVLSECLGVPRLLEKVFEAAASLAITDEAPCDTVRTVVAGLFKSHDKYKERQLRSDALLAALSGSWRPASDARQHKTRAAEREGYLFDGRIPPLLLKWWWCMDDERHQADEMHALLQAANGIYTLSDEVGGAEHGPRFERQLAHLWRILTITDAVSRREGDGTRKRTIHGMLGKGSDVARGAVFEKQLADKEAAFNRTLTDQDVDVLQLPFKSLDDPAHGLEALMPGAVYLPTDDQNPGYDWTLSELPADPPFSVLVLVEAKFSGVDVTTELSQEEIVEKFVLAVKKRPYVKKCLFESRLCYIIGGLRKVRTGVMANREALIDAIVESLRGQDVVKHVSLKKFVGQSLVLLTRDHTEALLTSTLSSLPPFGERW